MLAVALVCLTGTSAAAGRPAGWNEKTHGRTADPDYARVFPATAVTRIDIRIAAGDWATVMADMTDMAGAFGAQRQGGGPGGGFGGFPQPTATEIAACAGRVEGDACTTAAIPAGRCTLQLGTVPACVNFGGRGQIPNGGAGGFGGVGNDDVELFPRTPVYVRATVVQDGVTFTTVGFRLKGNSSLSNAWRAGSAKLPFRLNFDHFENEVPAIRDQTFFGFPNLAFTNNGTDTSFLRQRVATDLFRQAGVPAAHTAFTRVYIDRGQGAEYFGLYTVTEVPDTPFLNDTFGSDDGNLYKPHGTGGRWTRFIQESFPKRTNAADEDWTDIQGAIEALNEPRGDGTVWRARLEARFDVPGFLRWLALATIIGHQDAYGGLSAHNYYIYGSPRQRDRIAWITWDHDLTMSGQLGGGGAPGGAAPGGAVPGGAGPGVGALPGRGGAGTATGGLDLMRDGASGTQWPLIRFLLDDPVYRAAYRAQVSDLLATVFDPALVVPRLRREHDLIAPYVIGADGEQAGRTFLQTPQEFTAALDTLVSFVQSRAAAVRVALESAR